MGILDGLQLQLIQRKSIDYFFASNLSRNLEELNASNDWIFYPTNWLHNQNKKFDRHCYLLLAYKAKAKSLMKIQIQLFLDI